MIPIKKIVIIGGESTGKSTLCEALANHYHTVWVKEFAREYLTNLHRNYIQADLLEIAKGQLREEHKQFELANNFLFCDTDLNVLKVWSESKYNECHTFILDNIAKQNYDAYIVTCPDFPWQEDPLREHPNPRDRDFFFKEYLDIVSTSGLPFCKAAGSILQRVEKSIAFLNQIQQ